MTDRIDSGTPALPQGGVGQQRTQDHEDHGKAEPTVRDVFEGMRPLPPLAVSPWRSKYRMLLAAIDTVLLVMVLILTYFYRFVGDAPPVLSGVTVDPVIISALVGVLWLAALALVDSRGEAVAGVGLEEYRRVLNASLGAFGALAIGSYLVQAQVSRFFFAFSLPLGVVALVLGRWIGRMFLRRLRVRGRAVTRTVVIGSHQEAAEVVRRIRRNSAAGYVPHSVCLLDGPAQASPADLAALDGLRRVPYRRLRDLAASGRVGAFVVARELPQRTTRELSWSLEGSPVELFFVPRLTDVAGPRMHVRAVAEFGLVQVDLPRFSGWSHRLKRAFDVVFSASALIALSPLFLVLAVVIKFGDGGPVLFRQERIGLEGEPFVIHKFRTMVVDAESQLAPLKGESIGNGLLFKMVDDPRLTRVGGWLRRMSLDELPQFWTVLGGRMSVVGPRPHLEHELAAFPDEGLRRLLIKPGITGLWQVNGRSNLSLTESIQLDLSYVENWSLTGDLAIILRTVRAMFRSQGAY